MLQRSGKADAPAAATLKGRMRLATQPNRAGMWAAQIRAVENLEASIRDGRTRALIQMATGGGKTFTAISAAYRLITQGGARRVLFLVDRGNLGRQAFKEFQAYSAPDDGRKFHELYNVVNLSSNRIDPVNKVVITTIQRLYSILKGEPELDAALEEESAFDGHGAALARGPQPVVHNPRIPPEFFDVFVVDECHRSIYSLWCQVLDYFAASIIGLTATPGGHTYAYFGPPEEGQIGCGAVALATSKAIECAQIGQIAPKSCPRFSACIAARTVISSRLRISSFHLAANSLWGEPLGQTG